jgi:hypothetical protein
MGVFVIKTGVLLMRLYSAVGESNIECARVQIPLDLARVMVDNLAKLLEPDPVTKPQAPTSKADQSQDKPTVKEVEAPAAPSPLSEAPSQVASQTPSSTQSPLHPSGAMPSRFGAYDIGSLQKADNPNLPLNWADMCALTLRIHAPNDPGIVLLRFSSVLDNAAIECLRVQVPSALARTFVDSLAPVLDHLRVGKAVRADKKEGTETTGHA